MGNSGNRNDYEDSLDVLKAVVEERKDDNSCPTSVSLTSVAT